MSSRDPEYDAFGPWIPEISEQDPLPPVFEPAMARTDVPLTSFKVPRLIERRNARPGMHLYDYVVALYTDDVVILERDGDTVSSEAVRYDDISYVRSTEDLLRGVLSLATPKSSYRLPYSTVSQPIIDGVTRIIRGRYTPDAAGDLPPDREARGLSFQFEGLLRSIRTEEPQARVLASQPDTMLADLPGPSRRRHRDRVSGKRLLETAHIGDGRELRILSRGRRHAFRWQSIYAKETCHIPLQRIRTAGWHDFEPVRELDLDTDGGSLRFAFVADDAALEAYAAYLDKVAIRTR